MFLKLKDRFWRSKRVFMNVVDLTIHGLGFSAGQPPMKRKFELTACPCELLQHGIIELGWGKTEKQLSKHIRLMQSRVGYRPPAMTRILDDSGRTGGAILKTNPLRGRGERLIAHDA